MARLGNSQIADLKRLMTVDAAALMELSDKITNLEPSIKLSKLRDFCVSYLKDQEPTSALLRWAYFIRTITLSPNASQNAYDVLNSVSEAALQQENISLSDNVIHAVAKIVDSEQLYAVWQAQNLSRDAEHLYQNMNIVADCRPVFNQSRDGITGEIIMPFLKLSYSEDGEVKSISIALDSQDIDAISKEIDKIKRKIEYLKNNYVKKDAYLVGEEVDFASI